MVLHPAAALTALAHPGRVLVAALASVAAVAVPPQAPFVLGRVPDGERVRTRLRECGFAVRSGDTFPEFGSDWLCIAVRDRATTDAFIDALRGVLMTTRTAP